MQTSGTAPISVLIADDHALVRSGFRLLLDSVEQIAVVGEAQTGEQACALVDELKPDVLMIDLAMPGMGGIEAIRRIASRNDKVRILALSAHEDVSHPRRALQAGALGYLSKRQAPEAMVDAVMRVSAGKPVIDPDVAQRMAIADLNNDDNPLSSLSAKEFEVFEKLARGSSVNEIAETLHVSASTVGTHLYKIKQKLALNNQAEMTLLAVRQGLIQP